MEFNAVSMSVNSLSSHLISFCLYSLFVKQSVIIMTNAEMLQ